jgi:hypothetical protein
MFRLFEVKDGKFTSLPDISSKKLKSFLYGSFIVFLITLLSGWLKIGEKELWKFYNLLLQQLGLIGQEFRPENEKELEARIELEVDRAIQRVIPEYDRIIAEADQKYKPRYIDEVNDESVCYTDECKSLAPPMRICAPWVDTCPKD